MVKPLPNSNSTIEVTSKAGGRRPTSVKRAIDSNGSSGPSSSRCSSNHVCPDKEKEHHTAHFVSVIPKKQLCSSKNTTIKTKLSLQGCHNAKPAPRRTETTCGYYPTKVPSFSFHTHNLKRRGYLRAKQNPCCSPVSAPQVTASKENLAWACPRRTKAKHLQREY